MNHFEHLTDYELIDRILAGDKPLYELIVRRYNPYLYKIGRSYNYNHEDTQDLMQDTYVDAYKNLSHFEKRSGFKTWIVRIMLNNCYHKNKKSGYKNEFLRDTIHENSKPMFNNSTNDAGKQANNRELGRIIEQSLANIPEDYGMVFSLREMNGFNVSETAELLRISESNVKTRLSRAKAMLRNEIAKSYSPEDIYEFNLIYCDDMVNRVMKQIENL